MHMFGEWMHGNELRMRFLCRAWIDYGVDFELENQLLEGMKVVACRCHVDSWDRNT